MTPTEDAIDNLRNAPEDEQGRVSLDQGDCDLVIDELARLRAEVVELRTLVDELFTTFLIPHDPGDTFNAGWTRGASVRADVAEAWRARRTGR